MDSQTHSFLDDVDVVGEESKEKWESVALVESATKDLALAILRDDVERPPVDLSGRLDLPATVSSVLVAGSAMDSAATTTTEITTKYAHLLSPLSPHLLCCAFKQLVHTVERSAAWGQ